MNVGNFHILLRLLWLNVICNGLLNYYVESPDASHPNLGDNINFHFAENAEEPHTYCVSFSAQFVECLISNQLQFDMVNRGWFYSSSRIPQQCTPQNEICSTSTSISLTGFRTNSYAIAAYKLRIDNNNNETNRYNPSFTLLETMTSSFLPTFQTSLTSTLVQSLVNPTNIPQEGNMLFLNQLHPNPIIIQDKKSLKPITAARKLQIAFYFKELISHGANNRMIDWICNIHQHTSSHRPVEITILTTMNRYNPAYYDAVLAKKLTDTCQAHIQSYHCLSKTNEPSAHNDQDQLQAYLNEEVDVLMFTNTFGDHQTDRVVESIARCSTPPVVMIELSNLEIPVPWIQWIDVIVTPSRAVGFHPVTLQHGLPIAVIYPPINEDWLNASICFDQVRKEIVSAPQSQSQRQIEFVFIGRLEEEKCPTLLLKVVQYLLHHPDIDAQERLFFQSHAHLTIIGEGILSRPMQFYAKQYHLTDNIRFLGRLSPTAIQTYLNALHQKDVYPILINPRLSGETFGYVHIEALFMGIPTIAFNRGSGKESILAGELIDVDDDVEMIGAESVVERMAKVMLRAIREFPVKFSVEIICQIAQNARSQFDGNNYQSSLLQVIEHFSTFQEEL